MAAGMKRFMITVTPELEQSTEKLKQKDFYNKTYAEMYRYILTVGLKTTKLQEQPYTSPKN